MLSIKKKFSKFFSRHLKYTRFSFLREDDDKKNFIQYTSNYNFIFKDEYLNRLDPYIAKCLTDHINYGYVQAEYLYHYKYPCIFDPATFWAIGKHNKLIQASILHYSERKYPLPKIEKYKKKFFLRSEHVIASINYGWDNYWHFYANILGQVHYLYKNGLLKQTNILIPSKLYNKPYFQQALQLSDFLRNIQWLVQEENKFVRADEAYFCSNIELKRDHIADIQKWFNVSPNTGGLSRRIFINRAKSKYRILKNLDSIMPILKKYGFEILETDCLTLIEQVNIFKNTKYLAGVHGAGLVNMIFRGDNELSLLEIFPANDIRGHYYAIAQNFGYRYDAICGGEEMNGEFIVECSVLEKHLLKMLKD